MRRPVAYVAGTGRGIPAKVMTNHDFVALDDPGALDDPLVRRLEPERREIVVRHDLLGDPAPRAGDVRDGPFHAAVSAAAASRVPIWSFIPLTTACAATFTAFLMARAFDLPWEMMLTPFTPSNGAPPTSE